MRRTTRSSWERLLSAQRILLFRAPAPFQPSLSDTSDKDADIDLKALGNGSQDV
jgi:hypothetical protein